jgi:hypothetical protein
MGIIYLTPFVMMSDLDASHRPHFLAIMRYVKNVEEVIKEDHSADIYLRMPCLQETS